MNIDYFLTNEAVLNRAAERTRRWTLASRWRITRWYGRNWSGCCDDATNTVRKIMRRYMGSVLMLRQLYVIKYTGG